VWPGRGRGGQKPLPRCPKSTFLTKNVAPNPISIFLPRSLIGRLTVVIHGSGAPPRRVPPPRQIPGYAYDPYDCVRPTV